MYLKVIACEVLVRELAYFTARTPHMVDLEFLPQILHDTPEKLHLRLQEAINRTEAEQKERPGNGSPPYEAIVLGYGLCSNATVGLQSATLPLIIPRAHDCLTFFLGSKERYQEYFQANPGTYYYTSGWIERGRGREQRNPFAIEGLGKSYEEYVVLYGEENARYLMEMEKAWERNYRRAAYITLAELGLPDLSEVARQRAQERGWEYVQIEGRADLLAAFLAGEWDERDFLVVPPGETLAPTYDEKIVQATKPF